MAETEENTSEDGFDLRLLLSGALELKWHMLAVVALVVTVAAVWTLRQEKIYAAQTSLEYDPNPPRPLGNSVADDPVGEILFTREFIETQNHIITSRTVAERVVRELALHRDADFLGSDPEHVQNVTIADAALVLQARISVEPVRDTRVVWVRVEDRNPERAAALANAVADAYVEKTLEDRLGTTVAAFEWLSSQLDSLRHELEASELALHEFKRDNNVLSVSLEDRQNLVASDIQHFNNALTEARARRIELSARLNQLRVANSDENAEVHSTAIDSHPRVIELRQQLTQKTREHAAGALRYGSAHPSMAALQTEIATLRAQLRDEIDGIIRAAELDVREMREVENGLRSALDGSHEAGLALNLREIEYSRLNRERENNSKLYNVLLERTTETNLTRMMRFTHVRIVDRALIPLRPSKPRVVFNLALAALVGLLLAVGLALLLSRLDRRIRSPEDLEGLGVQVLGVVPATETEGVKRRSNRDDEASRTRDTLVHSRPLGAFAESIRGLRTNITFMSPDSPMRCLVVTSSGPGEGKTTVATNLSIALAQSGKRVLLIDTDLRRPRIHRVFGLTRQGMTTVLIGQAELGDVVVESEIPNLHVVGCGPTPPNPAELLHTTRFRAFLERAQTEFDVVVFDSPPLGAVADAAVIAAQVDGVIMVVQADRTTRDAAMGALRQLRDVGARFVGTVLNVVDTSTFRYGKGGYYTYYDRGGYYAERDDRDAEQHEPAARTVFPMK